jgi:hypothetical protein
MLPPLLSARKKMDKPPKAGAGEMIHLTADAGRVHHFNAESGLKT